MSQRRKVSVLTPAALASSILVWDFIDLVGLIVELVVIVGLEFMCFEALGYCFGILSVSFREIRRLRRVLKVLRVEYY